MPAQSLATDAFVLLKRPPAENFQALTVFSAEHGTLMVMQRVVKKTATAAITLDLFDEASLGLESTNQGRTWFLKEARLIARPANIGRSYETLVAASNLAAVIARNAVPEEGRAAVATLLRVALTAFAASPRPDLVYFKSLYCFARDEGYPLKQQWFPTLPRDLRAEAEHVLHTPLAEQEKPGDAPSHLKLLQRKLEDYLRAETEILLD